MGDEDMKNMDSSNCFSVYKKEVGTSFLDTAKNMVLDILRFIKLKYLSKPNSSKYLKLRFLQKPWYSPKTPKKLSTQHSLSVRTLWVQELCRHDRHISPVNNQ